METQLYSEGKLKNDFRQLTFTELNEKKIHLSEGKYHNGITTVIRMFAKKSI